MKDTKKTLKSHPYLVRVPHAINEWLIKTAWQARAKDPECRNGIATQINAIVKAAYEKANRKPRT